MNQQTATSNVPSLQNMKMPELPDSVKKAGESLGNSINDLKTSVNTSVAGFSQQAQAGVGASSQFLQSNTIFAKFAFILLIIIAFIFLAALGIILIQYFTQPSTNPYLIKGMLDGSDAKTITQNPSLSTSVPIYRSNNESTGLEFTWAFWIYIADLGTDPSKYQVIFNKGDLNYNSNGIASVNNGPGVYLTSGKKNTNTGASDPKYLDNGMATLHIVMDSNSPQDNTTIDIDNVPIRKWVHVAIRAQNTVIDVYVNGVISSRLIMNDVPKQNYNDINYAANGGFSGKISNLRYYAYALNVFEINGVVAWGPNTNSSSLSTSSGAATGNYSYLSNNWYSNKL
jgi:Concanavalin A-like lectin/glucanases superfamily